MSQLLSSILGTLVLRMILRKKKHRPNIHCQSPDPEVLILLVPGALLYPDDYSSLCQAFMNHEKVSSICLVICSPDWSQIDVSNFIASSAKLVQDSIESTMHILHRSEYRNSGMLETDTFGRYKNLVVVMHSLSGLLATGSFAMKKASAVVLLASSISQAVSGICPALRSFPLPVLSIFGEYDGQQHLAKVAIDLCNSGILFGGTCSPCFFAMIPKCNHASFSNGNRNAMRGDISIDNLQGSLSTRSVGHQVADLILSHFIPAVMSSGNTKVLHRQTQESISLLRGFLQELGRITRCVGEENPHCMEMMHVLKYCSGNEMMHADLLGQHGILFHHPGQLARADEFAVDVQKYILGSMHDDRKRTIIVTANVHTDLDTFKLSPVKTRETCTSVHIEVQCLANVPLKGTEYTTVSPCYAMKLVSPQYLSQTSELPSIEDMFNLAWHRAEESAEPALLRRFMERGHPLTIRSKSHTIPQRWLSSKSTIRDGVLTLHHIWCNTTGDHPVRVDDSFHQPAGLFCCHIPSIAWCMEYMYVHSLKDHYIPFH